MLPIERKKSTTTTRGSVAHLLPDSVRDHARLMFARIAARMIGSGCHWEVGDQADTADRCISAALAFQAAWRARRQIHDEHANPWEAPDAL